MGSVSAEATRSYLSMWYTNICLLQQSSGSMALRRGTLTPALPRPAMRSRLLAKKEYERLLKARKREQAFDLLMKRHREMMQGMAADYRELEGMEVRTVSAQLTSSRPHPCVQPSTILSSAPRRRTSSWLTTVAERPRPRSSKSTCGVGGRGPASSATAIAWPCSEGLASTSGCVPCLYCDTFEHNHQGPLTRHGRCCCPSFGDSPMES